MRRLIATAVLLCALPAVAAVWTVGGDQLRGRHADTLEDLLRDVPWLLVERHGAAGLPWQARVGAAPPQTLMLVVDGMPWQDPWSGENLWEDLPLALIDSVVVTTEPGLLAFGSGASSGCVLVSTRRAELPKVQTRIHLSQASFAERTRRLSFETPPGDFAFALGLDEFFTEGYGFSQVWGGDSPSSPGWPEVPYSRRRTLALRGDLASRALGPVSLSLIQSAHTVDLSGLGAYHRGGYRVGLALPHSAWGAWHLAQTLRERRFPGRSGVDLAFALRWHSPRLPAGLRLMAGADSHKLTLSDSDELLPRPGLIWAAAGLSLSAGDRLDFSGGFRWERDLQHETLMGGQARMLLGSPALNLELFAVGGQEREPWQRDRLPDFSLWPYGPTSPTATSTPPDFLRGGATLTKRGGPWGLELKYLREQKRANWQLSEGYQTAVWSSDSEEPQSAFGIGGDLVLPIGGARAGLQGSLLSCPDAGPEDCALLARALASLGRDFFSRDSRLDLAAGLEYRHWESRSALWRLDLSASLRVLDAFFWLRYRNALDWPAEEIAGFPVPPANISLGLDWHLDH